MYQANPLSVYANWFPFKTKEGETIAGPDSEPDTTTLIDSQVSLLLMLYMYVTQWIKGVPPPHKFTVDLEALANHPTKSGINKMYTSTTKFIFGQM